MKATTKPDYDQRLRELIEHLRLDNAYLRQELDLLRGENRQLREGEPRAVRRA